MRTSMLAIVLALAVPACVVGDVGDGGGSGSDPGGGGGGGGGGGTPEVIVTLDKPAVATELLTTNMVTATITGSGGFSGAVGVTATATDGAGNPIVGWQATLDQQTVTLTENGTATVTATVTIPSTNYGLAANVSIAATSPGVTIPAATSAFTVANQLTFAMNETAGQCDYPANGVASNTAPVQVAVGTSVRWVNMSTDTAMVIHSNGGSHGIEHEAQGTPPTTPSKLAQNDVYMQTATTVGDGNAFTWYCHAPGPTVSTNNIQVVAAP